MVAVLLQTFGSASLLVAARFSISDQGGAACYFSFGQWEIEFSNFHNGLELATCCMYMPASALPTQNCLPKSLHINYIHTCTSHKGKKGGPDSLSYSGSYN